MSFYSRDSIFYKADKYAHEVYSISTKLPKEELYGLTSQLRRAAVSVPLNIVEGYARQSIKSQAQFLRISYGSLKETQYLLDFAVNENLLTKKDSIPAIQMADELGKMLWSKTKTLASPK